MNMTEDANVENILTALSSFGVTKEKYDSFNYKYDPLKALAFNTVVTYRGRISYETEVLDKSLARGEITAEEYKAQLTEKTAEVTGDITNSLLSSLPQGVSDALEEIGQADLYTLIVGSIFYKLAGLLLPIIYMIMASNNLVAGQVDSGSMAYVLSTSTKRKTVVFTQAVYLIGSLFTMFCLGSIVSDGKINEQEYILIYPALVKVFGSDFDFASVKAAVSKNYAFKKAVKDYSKELASTLAEADESFVNDVIGLCLCVVSIDGKISFREKNYIKKLYKA